MCVFAKSVMWTGEPWNSDYDVYVEACIREVGSLIPLLVEVYTSKVGYTYRFID
jgi:hypothetical protein